MDFSSEGRILLGGNKSAWLPASNHSLLQKRIAEAGQDGAFTDFEAALASVPPLFAQSPQGARKVVLLLSDGVLEPDPANKAYDPLSNEFLGALRDSRGDVSGVKRQYSALAAPMARRLIEQEVLPSLRQAGIELFTVALGDEADRSYLAHLADETAQDHVESHSFVANHASDLMDVFGSILPYWSSGLVLGRSSGQASPSLDTRAWIDGFVEAARVIVLTDEPQSVEIKSPNGGTEQETATKEPRLHLFSLDIKQVPGQWHAIFPDGHASYSAFWIGQSCLKLIVSGLKPSYSFGEPIEVEARIHTRNQEALRGIEKEASVAWQAQNVDDGNIQHGFLPSKEENFKGALPIDKPGRYLLSFVLNAKDSRGADILPRPSLNYHLKVMPAFFVTPEEVDFGSARGGREIEKPVHIGYGLKSSGEVHLSASLERWSNSKAAGAGAARLPQVQPMALSLKSGQSEDATIRIVLPKKVFWGDYEGRLVFQASSGETAIAAFRVHVPTLWERSRWPLFILILIGLGIVIYLAWIWGMEASPAGILECLAVPPGQPGMLALRLGEVRRNFFARCLNYKRNRLAIGSNKADIRLPALPPDFKADLIFWGIRVRAYARNRSLPGNKLSMKVVEDGIPYELRPGGSFELKDQSLLEIGEYRFIYRRGR
jgi:hypothetical protein